MADRFFILGAPKCGTTSLAYWVSQHSQVSFSNPKETRFFNTDFSLPFRPVDIKSYEALFEPKPGAVVKGESTVNYLCSDVALEKILHYAPDSKFIVCIRPHVELFFSLHRQRLKEGIETVRDPQRAWGLNLERRSGRSVPAGCSEPKLLDYERFCMMGKQISRLLEQVGVNRVRIYQLSEIGQFPEDVFKDACAFLGVGENEPISYEVKNTGTVPRLLFISRLMRSLGILRKKMGIPPLGVATLLSRWNLKKPESQSINPEFLRGLEVHFKEDKAILDELLKGRDYL